MGENGAGRPAARAIVPPADESDSAISIAKLAPPRSEVAPAYAAPPPQGEWAQLATAPTLLLTPAEPANTDDAASTSRIATPPPTAVDEQPWFKTGTTVAPPAMRPMSESLVPPPVRKPPNPRVLKVVGGVLAACLFIVAVAGLKLIYKHFRAPTATQTPSEESTSRTMVAAVDLAQPPQYTPETARPADLPPTAPESAAPGTAPTAAQQAEATRRTTRVRPSPTRVTTKTTTRRAPAPKKTGRGTH